MDFEERKSTLLKLVRFDEPINVLSNLMETVPFAWPHTEPAIVDLTSEHVVAVLERFIGGELTAEDVDRWANMVECREDLSSTEIVDDVIFDLANPFMMIHPLSAESAMQYVRTVRSRT